ncbi:gamma-glutamyl-gamma-aminobutyrate hydrolase family protein [Sporolactobacillus shoreicorticis]|uniref:Gamma-glutamyl-gamma-aminobutyrate hydrolase family protein n=1 Tax=Sporolactobacillus shoreicorticis TaxID=1923877 RepID=A0ABW5S1I4_9BACL|nr:gamma-glutamyl-gamma-aminobutyrate hydrolase family protein [Sporolactobacillus shoreicorticis]MCO7125329.1 gamma-glutamyl-gamma-aminobutyrate hydrolase family protein [Sporolactobacillus shoreicorticis]
MTKAMIGIVPLWDHAKDSLWMVPGYMDGIRQAGAIPVMLPLTDDPAIIREISEHFEGFLFTGGHDVSPNLYGERESVKCGETCPRRDLMETMLFREVLDADKPAFGICRGIQLFNAVLGGTLYQDIPSELPSGICHSQKPPYDRPAHTVSIKGPLRDLLGKDEVSVNSYHHQGIKRIAPQLTPTADAQDGLVEAVYMPERRFVQAVQWHPEFAFSSIDSQKLFSAFVNACI